MKRGEKAFTLSELLVVVIVVGVLAAVAVPKFARVLETRKTSEAETMLGAMRVEQERRCAMGRPYTRQFGSLQAASAAGKSSHFSYELASAGASAQSKAGYVIRMPSYKEGALCCEGNCGQLNKAYPPCDGHAVTDECADDETAVAGEPEPDPEPEPETPVTPVCPSVEEAPRARKCGCEDKGWQIRLCNPDTGELTEWSGCSVAEECAPACDTPVADSYGTATSRACTGSDQTGYELRKWDTETCSWTAWDTSSCKTELCTADRILHGYGMWDTCCNKSSIGVDNTLCYKPCSSTSVSLGNSGSTQYGFVSTGKSCSSGGGSLGTDVNCSGITCDKNTLGLYCCSGGSQLQCGGGSTGSGITTVKTEWYCATSVACSTSCTGYKKPSSGGSTGGTGGGNWDTGLPGSGGSTGGSGGGLPGLW